MNTVARPLESIAGFAALLRDHGMKVGIAEQQAFVQAALRLPLERVSRLDPAWRAIACHDAHDWRRWPELFDSYWYPRRVRGRTKVGGQARPSRSLQQVVQSLHERMDGSAPSPRPASADTALDAPPVAEGDPAQQRAKGGASRTDALHDRSLSQWLPQDLALLQSLAERIAQRLRKRLTRRWHDAARGRRLDVRRTLRASLRTGGLPVHPVWRAVRREWPRLFILVDVSRSMETHAQLFLRIARAFVAAMNARVFVFHTRLAEVTPLLRSDSAAVQEKINAVTAGFGGGTRIATSVADFHAVHARAQLQRNARVWVLSDGFDADPPERLAQELARIRARGARVHWFHPSEAPPASQSMQAVIGRRELVEAFSSLTSLRDLADLAQHLR
ncbi:vWA domain-containing protein [Variovorax saccharolyticus]|uniref:vWA domain-containing protein n=1 Tax=Variovorax saccharolyticus TaxID=3053516 RepID=UPI0025774955|nr:MULTISPECIES: VWA domain-containing protein [unclassified Variovorax]MDM0019551.1 VWA domain-containing protein [Variovorax sp. J22R187]MDM0029393.1 VWA domain-containing protein [Variovorax sp. J31P216]